jgi:type IV pilus assembly protein PilB
LGQLLIALDILDPPQLKRLLEIQKEQPADERQPLGRICVDQGVLSKERLDLILDRWGKRLRIGELLVNRGKVTPAQLEMALEERRSRGGRLGEILIALDFVDEYTLTETLAEQHDLPYVPLMDLQLDPELIRYVNPQFADRNGVVPIGRIGRRLTVAIHDPTRIDLIRDLERSTGLQVQPVLATPREVHDLGRRLYEFSEGKESERDAEAFAPNTASPTESHLLSAVVERARELDASEIFLEPMEDGGRVRVRHGGWWRQLQGIEVLGGHLPELVKLVKTMALLDPTDERRLQEGFFCLAVKEGDPSSRIHIRVRTQRGQNGETAHLKLLDDSERLVSFDEIGLSDVVRRRFSTLITESKGVVLIVGPAGSGKRSTLRAALDLLRRCDRQVLTADSFPDEILRQEHNAVILEQALDGDAATRVFATDGKGPLVLAMLQASNTTSAMQRLLTFGVDPKPLSAALSGVLSQRLVRRNCPHCDKTYEPRRSVLDEWFRCEPPFSGWRRGMGCERCDGIGFSGRIVISELWVPSAEERVRIARATDVASLREAALRRDRCIGQDALEQVVQGLTTLEEALKRVPYEDVVYTRLHGLEREKTGVDDMREAV